MQEWEYKWVNRYRGVKNYSATDWNNSPEFANVLGDQGWELIAVVPRSGMTGMGINGFTSEDLWVFKRPKAS